MTSRYKSSALEAFAACSKCSGKNFEGSTVEPLGGIRKCERLRLAAAASASDSFCPRQGRTAIAPLAQIAATQRKLQHRFTEHTIGSARWLRKANPAGSPRSPGRIHYAAAPVVEQQLASSGVGFPGNLRPQPHARFGSTLTRSVSEASSEILANASGWYSRFAYVHLG